MTALRETLRNELKTAMKARDRVAMTAIRSALGAIDNAEAVPIDAIPRAGAAETSALGVGAADAARRELSETDVRALVAVEVEERRNSADELRSVHVDRAEALDAEADVLAALLD